MATLAYAPHVGPNGRTKRNHRTHVGGLGTPTTLRLVAIPGHGEHGVSSAPVAFRPVIVEPVTTLPSIEEVAYAPITPLRRPETPSEVERQAAARRSGVRRIRAAQLRRRRLQVLAVSFAGCFLVGALWAGTAAFLSQSGQYQVLSGSVKTAHGYLYRVQPGDTVWSIATRLAPNGDPRPIADQIEAENGGTNIQVGTEVLIP